MVTYLKCLGTGVVLMVVAAVVGIFVAFIVVLGMMGLEWFLGLFGATISLPPGVSRGSIAEPIVWVLWSLLVVPYIGMLERKLYEYQTGLRKSG